MIEVTRLNGKDFVLNAELIEVMEETPDTVITLTTGHKYVVKESLDEILDKIFTYKKNKGVLLYNTILQYYNKAKDKLLNQHNFRHSE